VSRFLKLQAREPGAVFGPDDITGSPHFQILLACINHSFSEVGRANRIFANRTQFGELSDAETQRYIQYLIDGCEFKSREEIESIQTACPSMGLWFYNLLPEWFAEGEMMPTNMRFLSMLVNQTLGCVHFNDANPMTRTCIMSSATYQRCVSTDLDFRYRFSTWCLRGCLGFGARKNIRNFVGPSSSSRLIPR